jgi:hypothetical protein
MKAVCHLMKKYNRDGIYPDVEKTETIHNCFANINEYIQINDIDYFIQTIQNVFTSEDGQIRVYICWQYNDYNLYIADCQKTTSTKILKI